MRSLTMVLICVLVLGAISPGSAHTPLAPGDNQDQNSATFVPDPAKSWVIYGHLHEPGEAAYFRMDLEQGDRLVLALNVNRADSPVPDLVVAGPGIPASEAGYPSLEIPSGNGIQVIQGKSPGMGEYEAFAPSVIYEVASYTTEINKPGTYYAVVYNTGTELSYSFVVGYKEEFTAAEWLAVPLSLVGIYLWEGQSPWFIAAPLITVILGGTGILVWRQKKTGTTRTIHMWMASLAGLLYIGTGAGTINQMFWVFSFTGYDPGCWITIMFAAIPVMLGLGALWIGWPGHPFTIRKRAALAIIGGLGLVLWAGLYIGPVLALISAILPTDIPDRGDRS